MSHFFKKLLAIDNIPMAAYHENYNHYSIIIGASNLSAIVQRQQSIAFHSNSSSVPFYNPFVRGIQFEAKIDDKSAIAIVDRHVAIIEHFDAYRDPPEVAFSIRHDFNRHEKYEIFTAVRYDNLLPYGMLREEIVNSRTFRISPFRCSFTPRTIISEFLIDLMFLDATLFDEPIIKVYDESETFVRKLFKMRRRSVINNHFFTRIKNPVVGHRYELSWLLPDYQQLIDDGISHSDFKGSQLDIFTSFLQKALHAEPRSIIESYNNILTIFSSAKNKIVLVDPLIDKSILNLLRDIKKNLEIYIIAGHDLEKSIDTSEIDAFIKLKQIKIFKLVSNPYILDKFIIIDNKMLFIINDSLRDITKQVRIATPLSENHPLTKSIIEALYKYIELG